MNILEMRHDAALLGPVRSGPSWAAWDAFHAAADGLPLTREQFDVYRECTERRAAPTKPFREVYLIAGRRAGKTENIADRAVHRALFYDYSAALSPGERGVIPILACDRRQARIAMERVSGIFDAVPMLGKKVISRTRETITLDNRIQLEVRTSSFRTIRGITSPFAVCEETSFWQSDDSANPDTEVLRALRPALSSIPTSQLLVATSPHAKKGVIFSAFSRFFGKEDERVLVWRAPSLRLNPTLDAARIEEAREEDPAAAASEFDAQFRNDIEDFISREVVDACVVPGRRELPPIYGVTYHAFVDPSGGASDSFTLGIAHRENERVVLDALRERRPPFSPDDVVREFSELLTTYGVTRVVGDRYSAGFVVERFRAHGKSYEPSEKTASELYRELLGPLNASRVDLLDHPRAIAQLVSLERRTGRSGRETVSHPVAGHDDVSNSLAGACYLARVPRQQAGTMKVVGY